MSGLLSVFSAQDEFKTANNGIANNAKIMYRVNMIKHLVFAALFSILFFNTHDLAAQVCQGLELEHDGTISIYVRHFDESVEVTYLDENGCWIPEIYQKLKYHFRSRGDGKEGDFDKRLVELADHLQDHFETDTVDVISVYRSPDFNQALRNAGRHVARSSYHMRGLAMDVHLPNVPDDELRDYLLSLKLGGVGYYPNMMVHMDFGPVRSW